jgi:hypothetical protein
MTLHRFEMIGHAQHARQSLTLNGPDLAQRLETSTVLTRTRPGM